MFDDRRGKRIVFVAHCILNQNTKLDRCAHYPGAILETVQLLMDEGIGIVQLPCPEMMYLGLCRQADSASDATVESEDTRIAGRMREKAAKRICERLAADVLGNL